MRSDWFQRRGAFVIRDWGGWQGGRTSRERKNYSRRDLIKYIALANARAKRFVEIISTFNGGMIGKSTLRFEQNLGLCSVHVTASCSIPHLVGDDLTSYERAVALAHDEWKKPPLDIGVERY